MVAVLGLQDLKRRLNRVEAQLDLPALRRDQEQMRAASSAESPVSIEEPLAPQPVGAPQPTSFPFTPAAEEVRTRPPGDLRDPWSAVEVTIGTQWLNWVGMILVIVGVMFFLKYAYDNQWIGPTGRIALGAIGGVAALIIGEQSRRHGYPILFQALTGGGLATFYGCIYFSFQVYQLTGQTVAFLLSILVTGLAVIISVLHNAPVICLLGQLGGFLSPVLISTGQNRPTELFTFVSILNLATMGCAFYKNWQKVNTLAFFGTWIVFAGWAGNFYDESQIATALSFSCLFYLMFLIVPTLRASTRRENLTVENLWLVAGDIVVEFVNNTILLYWDYRAWLGLAVILQALTLFAMFAYWAWRCREDSKTRVILLFAALALVTAAIPIQFRFYGIPIGWALEALLLGFIGQQYRNWVFQFAAMAAIILAAGGLVARLPLHTELFTPVLNRSFGSWATVIAMAFALSAVLHRGQDRLEESLKQAPSVAFGLAVVLLCALIHMEISTFWSVRREIWQPEIALSHQSTSLTFFWSAAPLILLSLGRYGHIRFSAPAALISYTVGLLVVLNGALNGSWIARDLPFLNLQWLSRFFFVVSLWIGANWMRSVHDRPEKWNGWTALLHSVEAAGHVILVFLLYAEVNIWISASRVFSPFMRFGFVSALWSLQALTLTGLGLRTRNRFRRILGFILFGVTVAKLLVIDMAILQPVYRILSFAATGALLIVAAYLYQKFARVLLESNPERSQSSREGPP